MKNPSCVDRVEDAAAVHTELNQVVDVVEIVFANLPSYPPNQLLPSVKT